MKKIIWIVNEYNGPRSIRTRQMVLSELLEKKGYEVYVIAANRKKDENVKKEPLIKYTEYDGAKFYTIKTPPYSGNVQRVIMSLVFQYRLWYNRNRLPKPDVIVSDFAGLFGNIFLKWKHKYGTRIIYDILDLWPEGFVDMGFLKANALPTKILYEMEHKSYREADGIIFSMQGGKDYIIDKKWDLENGGDIDISNIGYLNNGVDLDAVDYQRSTYIYDDVDLDSDKFKVIYLGSISAFNGLDILIHAAADLQKRREDNIEILIYGYGNQEKRLRTLASSLDLKNLKFKGRLDKRFAANVLSRGNLNVFTFKETKLLKYGTSPNKLFMYFASGKPVLSMIKPAYDLVEQENCGISVDNVPEKVADTIIKFSRMEKEEYDFYCSNSRRIANEYDYKNLVNVLINHIEG